MGVCIDFMLCLNCVSACVLTSACVNDGRKAKQIECGHEGQMLLVNKSECRGVKTLY